jgi:hypothetical protein
MGMVGGAGVGVAGGVEVCKAVGVTVGRAVWVSEIPVCTMATAVFCISVVLVCVGAQSVNRTTRNTMNNVILYYGTPSFIPHKVEQDLYRLIIGKTVLHSSDKCHGLCHAGSYKKTSEFSL